MINNKMRKGFTIVETIIMIVVLSILMLSAFSYFNVWDKIRKDVAAQENFKYYTNMFKNSLNSIDKIRGIMRGEDNVVLYDLVNASTLAANSVGAIEHVYLPLDNNGSFMVSLDSAASEYSKMTNIINFWGLEKENSPNFLKDLYVYTTNNTTTYNGDINVTYKNFTFIYISDDTVNLYLNSDAALRQEFLSKGFDTNTTFLSVNDEMNSTTLPSYIISNWQDIKNSMLLYKLSSKDIVLDVVKNIDKKMNESQQRVNDWATIQARFAAYKSLDSGNTMDTDYFISCIWNGTSANCDKTLSSTGQIYQNKTLLKNDSNTDNTMNSNINFKLITGVTKFQNLPTEYGFISFAKSNMGTTFSAANYFPFSITCPSVNNIDSDFDGNTPYEVFGASIIQSKIDTNHNFGTQPLDTSCILSDNIRNLMSPVVNDFGYDVYFTNSFLCEESGGTCTTSDDTKYTRVVFTNGTTSKTIPIKLNVPFQLNNSRLTYSPYNAVLFTLLPNGAVIKKNLVANSY